MHIGHQELVVSRKDDWSTVHLKMIKPFTFTKKILMKKATFQIAFYHKDGFNWS